MHGMILRAPGSALEWTRLDVPRPQPNQVLIKVSACGVCRTDLHVLDGELSHPSLPLIPGHEIVGTVVTAGAEVEALQPGDRVGVPWLGYTCGVCHFCTTGRENLCEAPFQQSNPRGHRDPDRRPP
jgi:propanol-preferring alcohol dehydrogenase